MKLAAIEAYARLVSLYDSGHFISAPLEHHVSPAKPFKDTVHPAGCHPVFCADFAGELVDNSNIIK
jgi:hypothetical protein